MVYTAQSKSLAILEVLVHIQKIDVLSSYSLIAARFDEDLVERLNPSRLLERWRDYPVPAGLRVIGDAWIESRSSVVLEVPSAIVDGESNYLMNPDHPNFASVVMGHPEPFEFDPRLLG
jgi:RES domain-containing protein